MADLRTDLVAELKLARKGRGVSDPQFAERYGPCLLAVLDLPHGTSTPEVRRATTALLVRLAEQLSHDLGVALLTGFGVHPEAHQRFYEERVEWLANMIQRDKRTAKRLIDKAVEEAADQAIDNARHRDERPAPVERNAWHCEGLQTVVLLGGPALEIIESRRVRSHEDGLDMIDLAVTLTGTPHDPCRAMAGSSDLVVEVLYGGALEHRTSESTRRIGLYLRLPSALAAGEQAEFMLRYRVPQGLALSPHYVAVPKYRCDHFDLHIRFGDRRPTKAYRLCSTFQADIEDPVGIGEPVAPDAAGEIHLTFDDLKPGFAYGATWDPPTPE